jgi:hypothetical protein
MRGFKNCAINISLDRAFTDVKVFVSSFLLWMIRSTVGKLSGILSTDLNQDFNDFSD